MIPEEKQTQLKPWTSKQLDNMIKKTNKRIIELNKRMEGLRFCPDCKKLLLKSDVHLGSFYCEHCMRFYQGLETLSQQDICEHKFMYECKKHGNSCRTYILGICDDANTYGKEPDKKEKRILIEKCILCGMVKK